MNNDNYLNKAKWELHLAELYLEDDKYELAQFHLDNAKYYLSQTSR